MSAGERLLPCLERVINLPNKTSGHSPSWQKPLEMIDGSAQHKHKGLPVL